MQLDPVSPLPIIVSLLIAIATSHLLTRRNVKPIKQGRFTSIDGLRGYLAFFVYLHHSCFWYFYLRTGQWTALPSNLYTHMGTSSVAFFFMITGFLFFSKLIDARKYGLDWTKLYISRFLRLAPMYLFSITLLFIIIIVISNGVLNETPKKLASSIIAWLEFTIPGAPDLNGITHTSLIIAGVTWSLPYEWFFYLSLPMLALLLRINPPIPYIALGTISLIFFIKWHPGTIHLLSFASGITASFLVRYNSFRIFAKSRIASFIILAFISITVIRYTSAYGRIPFILLSTSFQLIAGGNNMFGIFTHMASRTLGEMTYSIYLLHGIILFITFKFVIGTNIARGFSPLLHWSIIFAVSPILIIISFITYRFIEFPAMNSASLITSRLRNIKSQITGCAKLL